MRIWHYSLLPYLPDGRFLEQIDDLVKIMRDWRDKGRTRNALINRVMDYSKNDLFDYFLLCYAEHSRRYGKNINEEILDEFVNFTDDIKLNLENKLFDGWHNDEYLIICMYNLYEMHVFAKGAGRINDIDWAYLVSGYAFITGENLKKNVTMEKKC